MEFIPYQHIEKWERDEVEGIEVGKCHIFPKIDGTNGSVWWNDNLPHCASRKREIKVENGLVIGDNQGFAKFILNGSHARHYDAFFKANPELRLYGEWLVPHTLKTYAFEAWRKFYVFDVARSHNFHENQVVYMPYEFYQPLMEEFGLDYIPCSATIENPTTEVLLKAMQCNMFLIQDGEGIGEGIVIKNYDFVNKFGRTTWAKMVANEFKAKHDRTMGPAELHAKLLIETKIAERWTEVAARKVLVDLTHGEEALLPAKEIPKLLGWCWYTFIHEELWDALKALKNPIIDFRQLQKIVVQRTKTFLKEVF